MNKPQRIKIETPIGSIESDSGNHLVDIGTVFMLAVSLYLINKFCRFLYCGVKPHLEAVFTIKSGFPLKFSSFTSLPSISKKEKSKIDTFIFALDPIFTQKKVKNKKNFSNFMIIYLLI